MTRRDEMTVSERRGAAFARTVLAPMSIASDPVLSALYNPAFAIDWSSFDASSVALADDETALPTDPTSDPVLSRIFNPEFSIDWTLLTEE